MIWKSWYAIDCFWRYCFGVGVFDFVLVLICFGMNWYDKDDFDILLEHDDAYEQGGYSIYS